MAKREKTTNEIEIQSMLGALQASLEFVCEDPARSHLAGVRVVVNKHDYLFEATDGHTAIQSRCKVGKLGEGDTYDMFLETAQAKALIAAIKLHQKVGMPYLHLNKESQSNDLREFCKRKDIDCRSLEELGTKYPPIDQVFPHNNIGTKEKLGVNPSYLARLTTVAKVTGMSRSIGMEMRVFGALDPIWYVIKGDGITSNVLIMPIRL